MGTKQQGPYGLDERENRYLSGLQKLSTLDGRECLLTGNLDQHLSEKALHSTRAFVEVWNLRMLSMEGIPGLPKIPREEFLKVLDFLESTRFDAKHIAEYDHFGRKGQGPFEHDVKSVEIYLREVFEELGLEKYSEYIHFPMTSEDVNNISWNIMLRSAVNGSWKPKALEVCDKLNVLVKDFADSPVLGITHGMSATPTTFGKRFAHFLDRFVSVLEAMQLIRLSGKYSGPTGNHNAMTAVMPDFDFQGYAGFFTLMMGFPYAECENQRNSHTDIVRLFNEVSLFNQVAMDLCEHIRHSVMMRWIYLETSDTHVGSSVMPHKVNPWFFEVAEGYLEKSDALINASKPGLIKSVFERDLTDHPWERSYGELLGNSLVGLSYIAEGLDLIRIDEKYAIDNLKNSPEILAEAVQIGARLSGVSDSYMEIKKLTRGKRVTLELIREIIQRIIPDGDIRNRLLELTPETYIGKAPEIARGVSDLYEYCRPAYEHDFLYPMSGVRAVLFDFDGTLHFGDKQELFARLKAINEEMSLGFSVEQIERFGDRSDYREMKKMMVEEYNRNHHDSLIMEDEFQVVNDRVSGKFDHFFTLAEGAVELLQYLKREGFLIGLVTTRGSNSLPRLLKKHEIEDYFDVIIDRDKCKERKPHPQPIAEALRQLDVEGHQAVFIGDKQVDDIIAGKALDMQTILINDSQFEELGAIPTFRVGSMYDILNLF